MAELLAVCVYFPGASVHQDTKRARHLDKLGNRYTTSLRQGTTVYLNSLDFMECLSCEIAGAAVRAPDDRHVLDDQKLCTLSVAPCYVPDLGSHTTAILTA